MVTHRFGSPNRSVVKLQRLQEAHALLYHENPFQQSCTRWSCYQRVKIMSVLCKDLAVVQPFSNCSCIATSQSASQLPHVMPASLWLSPYSRCYLCCPVTHHRIGNHDIRLGHRPVMSEVDGLRRVVAGHHLPGGTREVELGGSSLQISPASASLTGRMGEAQDGRHPHTSVPLAGDNRLP